MTISEKSLLTSDDLPVRIEEAQSALRKAPYGGLKAAVCRLADDRLVLTGSVPSFYVKQMAQTVLLQALGEEIVVDNQLEVECTISTDLEIIGEECPDRRY